MKKQQKKHHRGNFFSNIILIIAIGIFLFSGYKLYDIYAEYRKGDKEYEHIQKVVIQQEPQKEEDDGDKQPDFIVDFEALKSMNQDTVGWIRFDEPKQISYPLVKGLDNSKYLRTTFEGKRNAAGALFLDVANAADFSDRNTFIYGHNMKNGSMFGQLRKFKNAAFCEQNPYFYISTPDGRESKYQIFAVKVVSDTSANYRKEYMDDADFLQYIQMIRQGSVCSPNVEIGADAKIVSLSTCTNVRDDERLLVHGVKISEKIVGE